MTKNATLDSTEKQIAEAQAKAFADLTEAQKDELVSEVRSIARQYESEMEDAARSAESDAADSIEALYGTYGADAVQFAVDEHGRADDYTHQCESLSEVARYRMN